MNDPVQLTDLTWYDPEENSILITYDRITLALALDEFLEFFEYIEDTKEGLLEMDNICIGTYEEEGQVKKELVILPPDEEVN